ncbi:MAG: ABC transporter permease [Deltaproteobacteria bacterium]|nr:ABC transporter permease [Deltaproteobacteria bacterium]
MRGRMGRTVFLLSLGAVGLLALLALLAPWVAPYTPQFRGSELLARPSAAHFLGTDQQGRDILTLLLYGGRVALLVGFGATLLSMLLGIPLGLISGYKGGKVDAFVMGICEVVFSFPGILLAILLVFITQQPSVGNVVVALSATGWAGWARLVRGQVLQEKHRDYVLMARTAGAGTPRILLHHILPNLASVLLVQFSFAVGSALLAESSLSFLGLGPQNLPSWGSLLSEGAALFVCSPWMATFSGLAIFVSVLSFNVIGDRLRDRFAQPDLVSATEGGRGPGG